tara:strand:- start:108 stop:536 length:429 start_codon:yes stop_codon:yes gene_type:complete
MTIENYLITSLDQYNHIFDKINSYLSKRCIILFTGELGSGKTSFIKELLLYRYKFNCTTSPTFGIINSYSTDEMHIFHYDLYRIKNCLELDEIGFYNNLDIDALHLIEWPEIIPKGIIEPHITINFETNNEERIISIKYLNE